jgi:hypothetical protein
MIRGLVGSKDAAAAFPWSDVFSSSSLSSYTYIMSFYNTAFQGVFGISRDQFQGSTIGDESHTDNHIFKSRSRKLIHSIAKSHHSRRKKERIVGKIGLFAFEGVS